MRVDDVRILYDYDRWATARILDRALGVPPFEWSDSNRIDLRGLGGILAHALGAHERWRTGWQGGAEIARREVAPLPTAEELRADWELEWSATTGFIDGLTDDDLDRPADELLLWQAMAHVVNHGTQHRSEAAVLLTALGRSPGDLDLADFLEERARARVG
jgi:uncharacterized damage-inducible protein DinB